MRPIRLFPLLLLPLLAGCTAKFVDNINRQQWQQIYQPLPFDERIDARVSVELADTAHLGWVVDAWFKAGRPHIVEDLKSLFTQPLDAPDGTEQARLRLEVEAAEGGMFDMVFPMRAVVTDPAGREIADARVRYSANQNNRGNAPEAIHELKGLLVKTFRSPDVAAVLGGASAVVAGGGDGAQAAPEPATGIYGLEEEIPFNVLDRVVHDPKNGTVALMGHHDPAYPGPRIPYLQHLAELLEDPRPTFSLEWTPASERAVERVAAQLESASEAARLAGSAAAWFGSDGRPTAEGARLLKLFGADPVRTGGRPGLLGVTGGYPQKDNPGVVVTAVQPDSPAERAGIRPGDKLFMVDGHQPWHLQEVIRAARRAGAGTGIEVMFWRGDSLKTVKTVLHPAPGTAWQAMTRYDVIAILFELSGRKDAAVAMDFLARAPVLEGTQLARLYFDVFAGALGVREEYRRALRDLHSGRVSRTEGMRRWIEIVLAGLERTVELEPGSLTRPFNARVRNGTAPELALEPVIGQDFDRAVREPFERVLRELLHKNDQIVMDLGRLEALAGSRPVVEPRFTGVNPTSQLARVLFQADYVGKAVIVDPEVAGKVPGLMTEYAFRGGNPGPAGEDSRMWIDIAGADLAVSTDGNVLETQAVRMQFNVRTGAGEMDDPYGDHLSGHYDGLARLFPAYHELREAAKLLAAARWIRSRDPDFTLPREGRTPWRAPAQVDGQLLLIWSPNDARVVFNAPGGAGLDFDGVPPIGPGEVKGPLAGMPVTVDASVVDLRGLGGTPVLLGPTPPSTTALRRNRPMFVEPPPPRPRGWVTRSRKGREVMEAVTVRRETPADADCDPVRDARVRESVDRAEALAAQLDRTERAVDAITAQNPENLLQREGMARELTRAKEEFQRHAVEIASQGLLDAEDALGQRLVTAHSLGELVEGAEALQEARGELEAWRERVAKMRRAWEAFDTADPAAMQRSVKDGLDLLQELGDRLAHGEKGPLAQAWKAGRKTVQKFEKAVEWAEVGRNLYTLGNAQILTSRLDPKVEAEAQALRDTLLPLMEKQRRALDAALAEPGVREYLEGNTACGG